MAHTFTNLLTHVIFSTKDRAPYLEPDVKNRLFAYMGGIVRELDARALLINGPADHVHILASLPGKLAPAELIGKVKANSSGWIHKEFPRRRAFAWQVGYAAFSVSRSQRQTVLDYIANQEEHHRHETFQEEFRRLLRKYGIEWDERYVWD